MSKTQPYRCALVFAWLLGSCFVALAGWLYRVQVVKHGHYLNIVQRMHDRPVLRVAKRGAVLDRGGTQLATSAPFRTICADPSLIFTQHLAVARTLSPLLAMSEQELLSKLLPQVRTKVEDDSVVTLTNQFVLLKRRVPLAVWDEVRERMAAFDVGMSPPKKSAKWYAVESLKKKAIYAQDGYLRQYPEGSLAAHVLGFTAMGEVNTEVGSGFEDHGVTGIEELLDGPLSGAIGWKRPGEDLLPRPGLNVVLTLDAGLQRMVEEELARGRERFGAKSTFAVVVRPTTGEILALANAPTLHPEHPGSDPEGLVNHIVGSLFEPGSTFKILTIAAALEAGLLTLDERVNCHNGRWFYGGRILHDYKGHGILSFKEILVKSSNIGTAQAALRLGPDRLYHAITNFGFGSRTQIMLPGERSGVISHPHNWSGLSITRIPIGHEVSATPLQMAMMLAAFGNKGILMRPMLVDRLEDQEGRLVVRYSPVAVRRVMSEATAAAIVDALREVASEEGTARLAELEQHSVSGKTGTSEKFFDGTYKSGKYYASFYALVPAENPELCILVGVDEPTKVSHMGGATAGVIFKAIADRALSYLHIPPDIAPELAPEPRRTPKQDAAPQPTTRKAYAGQPTSDRRAIASR